MINAVDSSNFMNSVIFYFCTFILFFIELEKSNSQNIFSYNNSMKYGEYLYQSKQYQLAIEEFQRAIFLLPQRDSAKLRLIQSYRKANLYSKGIDQLQIFFSENTILNSSILSHEYLKLNSLLADYEMINSFVNKCNQITNSDKYFYKTSCLLIKGEWKSAKQEMKNDSTVFGIFRTVSQQIDNIKYKSPFLAASLSSIVPGAGKIYSKSWIDAIFAFIFVGTNTLQAFRGFKRNGTKSVYGWVFGTLAVSFYFGNIYGSAKSAKRYNLQINNKIHEDAENIILSTF